MATRSKGGYGQYETVRTISFFKRRCVPDLGVGFTGTRWDFIEVDVDGDGFLTNGSAF